MVWREGRRGNEAGGRLRRGRQREIELRDTTRVREQSETEKEEKLLLLDLERLLGDTRKDGPEKKGEGDGASALVARGGRRQTYQWMIS